MATRKTTGSTPWRILRGESVLFAAREIDTKAVKARLEGFERAQRGYIDAHRRLQAAEAQVRTSEMRVEGCDAVQDEAVATLARALIADGQPLDNAFEAYGVPRIKTLTRLPFPEAAKAVHELVAAVQRDKNLRPATLEAAQAAEQGALAVEQALAPYQRMLQGVREAKRKREVRAQAWDAAVSSLRHDAVAAARDGAPHIYATLFPPSRQPTKPKTTPAATSPPATETPAPAAPATESQNAA